MGKRRLTIIRITMPTTISFHTPCLKSEMFIMKSKFKICYRGKSTIHRNVVIKYVATLSYIFCMLKNTAELNATETLNGARENSNDSWQDRDKTTRVELRPHNLFTWEYRGNSRRCRSGVIVKSKWKASRPSSLRLHRYWFRNPPRHPITFSLGYYS